MEPVQLTNIIPPTSISIEQAVLGSMLLAETYDPDEVLGYLDERSISRKDHLMIFEAIRDLHRQGKRIDMLAVEEWLKAKGQLEYVNPDYLANITRYTISGEYLESHCYTLKNLAVLRGLIQTGVDYVLKAQDGTQDGVELVTDFINELTRQMDGAFMRDGVSVADELKHTLAYIESLHGTPGGITGIPSGFAIDKLTAGWQPGDLIILAGRPSMGKTGLALDMAENAAMFPDPDKKAPVAIFSLEMSRRQLMIRMIASQSSVNSMKLRQGTYTEDEMKRVMEAAGKLYSSKIFIDDTPGININELRAKAVRLKKRHNIGLVIVDYLQLVVGPKSGNRELEIATVARGLKNLAKELDVPVIALSQLSRAVEDSPLKKPTLRHLRESGEIEQAADGVIFLWRPEYYKISEYNGYGKSQLKGRAFLHLAKQRNGPIGETEAAFDKQFARFRPLQPEYSDKPDDAASAIGNLPSLWYDDSEEDPF